MRRIEKTGRERKEKRIVEDKMTIAKWEKLKRFEKIEEIRK